MFTIFKSHPSLTAALLATVATLALASSPADAMGFGRGGGHGGGFSRPAMGGGISRPAMTRMPMGGGQMRPMNTTRAAPRVASRPAGVGDGIRRGRSAGELGKASGRTIEARHARPAPARSNVADRSERHAAKHTAARHELDQARRAEFERHHEHRRREHHDFVPVSTFVTLDPVIPTDTVIIPPTTDTFVVPPTTERPSFVTVIGDDPKDSKTQEKAKAPACKWAIADVTITSWDKEMTVEKQQTWWKKFKEEALSGPKSS